MVKSFKEFCQNLDEEVPTNAVSTGAVASVGVGQSGEPPAKKSKKDKNLPIFLRRKI